MQDLGTLEKRVRSTIEFLSLVSHELRSPLTSVKGSAAAVLARAETLSRAEMLQYFTIINEQADHMQCLIADFLDAGCINTGTLAVFAEPWDVVDVVERARTLFLSGSSQHAICIDLPTDLPRIMVDSQRIVQVLNNLFANAAKNSPASSPIRVAACQNDRHIEISVSDEGIGVCPQLLPHLFEQMAGFGIGEVPGSIGLGLGLSICKGIVEAHGGQIWAESDGVGLGACFTFTVPVVDEVRDRDTAPQERREASHLPDEYVPILIVDDDPNTIGYVQNVLNSAGYTPIVASNHRLLSQTIAARNPRLVLLDLVLPETDGITLMEQVPALAEQPVIFLSAYGRDETIARALETGAVDYIVKPVSSTELVARIRSALRTRKIPNHIVVKDLVINYDEHVVSRAGVTIPLTATEYRLLRVLSLNAGSVVSYRKLIRMVWDDRSFGTPDYVRNYVKKLRRKLDDYASNPTYIQNVRGIGYKLCKPTNGRDGAGN